MLSDDDVFGWDLRCFTACFCESGDLLSQWRGYAGGVGGYAIGFPWDALAERSFALHPGATAIGTTPFEADLRRVTYGIAAAEGTADQFMNWLQYAWSPEGGLIHMVDQEPGIMWLLSIALRELTAVKNHAFQEEHEWRLSALSELKYPVRVRARPSGLVPFLDIAVNMKPQDAKDIPPTIAELVVGPGPNQLSQLVAARELLKACGHDPDVVVGSEVPFRG